MSLWLTAFAAVSFSFGPAHGHAAGCSHVYLPEYDRFAGWFASQEPAPSPDRRSVAANPEEKHLSNLYQLTFGGQNAEAYWSKDGKQIVYQSRQPEFPDEQIYIMNADGSAKNLVSTGKGRTTCSYFSPDGQWLYFSSTHERNEGAQRPVDMSKGYVWMVNPDFALYRTPLALSQASSIAPKKWFPVLKKDGAYVAETTISPDGSFMVFTSDYEGDLEIYRSKLDGSGIRRLTDHAGYDGGPFVSWDGKKIVYRRDSITGEQDLAEYRRLLKEHLVRPSKLEIWIMDADGGNGKQVTQLGCASFAPFLHPNGKQIIFSSNYGDPKGREFDLWMIDIDGQNLTRVTHTPEFDGFPMFSRDGKKLVWASNRYGSVKGETNIFVADWQK